MSKAIDELRGHFNQKLVPNSKTLLEERDKVNALIDAVETENSKLLDMCSELYLRYWDVEGDLFIDPDMDELEGRLRELGIETWETWQ